MLSPAQTTQSSPISVMKLDWEITTGIVPAIVTEVELNAPPKVTRTV